MITIAILGGGFMAASHAANYRALGDRVRVKTVASRHSERAAAVAASVGAELTDDLPAALRDPDVDAVDICLPTPLHREWAEASFAAGKHVLLEKPIALTLEDADAIVGRRSGAAGSSWSGSCCASGPSTSSCSGASPTGELGRPLSVSRGGSLPRRTGTTGWATPPSRVGSPLTY